MIKEGFLIKKEPPHFFKKILYNQNNNGMFIEHNHKSSEIKIINPENQEVNILGNDYFLISASDFNYNNLPAVILEKINYILNSDKTW